jgi:hypothetical protein
MVIHQLHVGLTDAELIDLMRQAKQCRHDDAPSVTCSISGYDNDSRELADIPEVRALCKRLVDCGYVAFLDPATSIRELPTFCACMSLGAWEIWRMSRNAMGPSGHQSVPHAVLRDFLARELPRLKAVADDHLSKADVSPPPGGRQPAKEAAAKASGAPAETRAQLRQIAEDSEPLLQQLWKRRKGDDDLIILADMRRPECRRLAEGWWSEEEIRAALEGTRPFLPYLQPAKLIDLMLAGGSRAQRQAAKELRGFARAGFVPLWVVIRGGHWATAWAPPGSGREGVHCEPEPKPEDN